LTFDHSLGKCGPIYKFFYCQIAEEILYAHIIKILHLTLNMFLHYLVKLDNCNCWRFQWHTACETSHNSSCKLWGRLLRSESCDYKIWNIMQQCLEEDPWCQRNWSSGWLTCNMGCSRQSLIKLAPLNGVNVCELLFVSKMDVFSTLWISAISD